MAREKGRGITGFQDVATDGNVNANINNDVNNGINPSVEFEKIADPLEKLQEENPRKELTTVMKGIYFDSEVWDIIEQESKSIGRGGKSQLVNEIVKNYFIKKGLL
ncbi:hypothetical protein COJ96_10660 [Bacillus sp. AFS073361]|uniref:hypothetical protein n=1 Tax=Bacillus sp. AFS073361 TaxID=2033511 RepID=UPI000BFA8FDA|nr:hypothetical protein [Bacillus sp. AFS073361]PFP29357.1 hypothetical protein COJ96_10660 [Bacillus sp. AFS073361]